MEKEQYPAEQMINDLRIILFYIQTKYQYIIDDKEKTKIGFIYADLLCMRVKIGDHPVCLMRLDAENYLHFKGVSLSTMIESYRRIGTHLPWSNYISYMSFHELMKQEIERHENPPRATKPIAR